MKHSTTLWQPEPNTSAWYLMLELIATKNAPLNSPVFDEVMSLHETASDELTVLQKNEAANQEEIENFKELIILAINVVKTPENVSLASMLKQKAEAQVNQGSIFSDRFLGALMALAAAVLIGLSIFAVPLVGTISAQYVGGSLLAAGGASLFYRGMNNTRDKFTQGLATLADKALKLAPGSGS